jgi:xanthine dehydrogenase/oxidase
MQGRPFHYFAYGVGCTEVEVNCHTGDVTVLSANLVEDVGRSLNPAIDIGQIEGAYLQGLGYCTTEQLIVSPETGAFLTTGPGTYKVPTVADVPKDFNVMLLKSKPMNKPALSTLLKEWENLLCSWQWECPRHSGSCG